MRNILLLFIVLSFCVSGCANRKTGPSFVGELPEAEGVQGIAATAVALITELHAPGQTAIYIEMPAKLPIIEKALAYMAGYGMKAYIIVQDITQLNAVYGKDNAIMANCHVRIAYAPNTVETAETLSKMLGTTTVVEEKRSISGSGTFGAKSTTINISEIARPLLTADECMRLPSAEKDAQGRVTKPGHMLIFTAGKSPIYGCQILYFRDPTFSARAKMKAPGVSVRFPSGISDSLYFKRPDDWFQADTADVATPAVEAAPAVVAKAEKRFESYLNEEDVA